MKTAQGGYKAMIRDRCPRTVDLALKWCYAKTKWVEYVYSTFVWFLKDKKDRDAQVRALLGYHTGGFVFDKTIEWDSLTKEESEYWTNVSAWVNFFTKETLAIADMYETLLLKRGEDPDYIKQYICKAKFGNLSQEWQDKLYKYLIDHIKKYYVQCIFPRNY